MMLIFQPSETFTYLGSQLDCSGVSESDTLRRILIAVARECTKSLSRNIGYSARASPCLWKHACISFSSSLWIWDVDHDEKIDVFDASGINFSDHMSNQAVRDQTGCTPVSKLIKKRRLCLFGHTARSYVELDHCSALCDETENPPQSYLVVVFLVLYAIMSRILPVMRLCTYILGTCKWSVDPLCPVTFVIKPQSINPGEGQEDVCDTHGPAQWNPTCIRPRSACTLPGVELKTIRLGEHIETATLPHGAC